MLQQPATGETRRLHRVSRVFDAAGLCVKAHYAKLCQVLAGSAAVNSPKSLVEASVQAVALKAEQAQAVAAPATEKTRQQQPQPRYRQLQDLLPQDKEQIFYLKIKSDYHRYLAEFKAGAKRKEAAENTLAAYKAVQDIALTELAPTNHAYQLFDEMPKIFEVYYGFLCLDPWSVVVAGSGSCAELDRDFGDLLHCRGFAIKCDECRSFCWTVLEPATLGVVYGAARYRQGGSVLGSPGEIVSDAFPYL
uniref:14-3-3 domain-containing protein n=1 Tax=Ananas comosus var. bracteatus TaxID=296719 RepID=A0A6V7Q0Q6_ANACO|nr:unnamed protein product [Ananas comosus var. bracteatus]